MELKHLAVLVLGQELPEHVGEVARALDDKEVKREPRIGLNECSCAGAKLLLAGVEEPEVVGNRHVIHNPRVARHGSVNNAWTSSTLPRGPRPRYREKPTKARTAELESASVQTSLDRGTY